MKKNNLHDIMSLVAILMMLPICTTSLYAKKRSPKNADESFITCDISKREIYAGESAVVTFTLHTSNPNVESIDIVEPVGLKKGEFGNIYRIQTNEGARREVIDGQRYYSIPIDSYVFTIDEKGNYEFGEGEYEVISKHFNGYVDPFGRYYADIDRTTLGFEPASLKVKSLPENKSGESFCGAIGNFKIYTVIPPGDIYLNEPAIAIVKVKGYGTLPEHILPEYKSAFSGNVTLKSVSESRNKYYDGKGLVSELRIECEFIPGSKDAEIGSVKLGYFNPESGTYSVAESKPVRVNAQSVSSQVESVEI